MTPLRVDLDRIKMGLRHVEGKAAGNQILKDMLEMTFEIDALRELERVAVEWIKARNALSGDALALGISSSSDDLPKWVTELMNREKPLRTFMEQWVWRQDQANEGNSTT